MALRFGGYVPRSIAIRFASDAVSHPFRDAAAVRYSRGRLASHVISVKAFTAVALVMAVMHPGAKEGTMVEVSRGRARAIDVMEPSGTTGDFATVVRAGRSYAGPAQAARVAALALLVKSGQYRVPGVSSSGSPLRAYRTVGDE